MSQASSPGMMRPPVAVASTDELKGELLRVRRELANVDAHLASICRELSIAADTGDRARMDDARNLRQSLWKDKEQLRVQETIFLKLLYDPSSPAIHALPADSLTTHPTVPLSTYSDYSGGCVNPAYMQSPVSQPLPSPMLSRQRSSRKRHLLAHSASITDSSTRNASGFEVDFSNPSGYEVNRSSDCKVRDVWMEWKVGLSGQPSVESLEEERKRDRKKIWWKSMNDYKYWSKQMRIIHAVEEKARELGGDVEASIAFWEDILAEEFDGSVSKLREALGGQKSVSEDEIGRFKRRCRELLQQGLVRMARRRQQEGGGAGGSSLTSGEVAPAVRRGGPKINPLEVEAQLRAAAVRRLTENDEEDSDE